MLCDLILGRWRHIDSRLDGVPPDIDAFGAIDSPDPPYNLAMDLVTGAVVIVGMQKVASPAADLVKDFLGRILAPSADAIGTAVAHPIMEWQQRRVLRAAQLLEDAARAVVDNGGVPQPVPGRLLMPILERASVEDDERLSSVWARLLARASIAPSDVLPAFIDILGALSPEEATILRRLKGLADERQQAFSGAGLEANPTLQGVLVRLKSLAEVRSLMVEARVNSVAKRGAVLANLRRLALVDTSEGPAGEADEELEVTVTLTKFGLAFVDACEGPARASTPLARSAGEA